MTNDAKFGLVIGIGLVILIAIVFFRKDPCTAARAAPTPATVAAVPAASDAPPIPIVPAP
jgi:hypothetical protein